MNVLPFSLGMRVRVPEPPAPEPLVPDVSDSAAAIALDLLAEAPTLCARELSAWLGITERQAGRCIERFEQEPSR